jgi:hypothetical protein
VYKKDRAYFSAADGIGTYSVHYGKESQRLLPFTWDRQAALFFGSRVSEEEVTEAMPDSRAFGSRQIARHALTILTD